LTDGARQQLVLDLRAAGRHQEEGRLADQPLRVLTSEDGAAADRRH
jgi:hypothetical protein